MGIFSKRPKITIAFMPNRGRSAPEAALLVGSLRAFGGPYKHSSVIGLVPSSQDYLSSEIQSELEALDVQLLPFEVDEQTLKFPFGAKVLAAAAAESALGDMDGLLVWMDTDTLILDNIKELSLEEGKLLDAGRCTTV